MDKGNNRIGNWITVYWKDNQPYPTGSQSYHFHDAPKNQANVTERLNDRKTTDDKGWGQTLAIPKHKPCKNWF